MSRYVPGDRRPNHHTFHRAADLNDAHLGHLVTIATNTRPARGYLQALAAEGEWVRLELELRDGRVVPAWAQHDTTVLVHRTTQRKDAPA